MLPIPPNAFVGREADCAAVIELLDGSNRLLTLWGPGGVGKTRLALEVARQIAPVRPTLFVDLEAVRGAEAIAAAVAGALGISLAGVGDPEIADDKIGYALDALEGPVLLLDNFDAHVALADVTVGAWLPRALDARVLVTSRQRLRLEGEVTFEVPALKDAAAALFIERVRALSPGYEVPPEQQDILQGLLAALDGLPLAIELAAARFDVLGLKGLADRLAKSSDVLRSRSAGVGERQSTLTDTIAWSWDLLDDEEKAALQRCAVFEGGFGLPAAEAVVGVEAIDALEALRDRSLLRVSSAGGHVRFSMLGCIRAFALERLEESGGEAAARSAHAAYYGAAGRSWAEAYERRGDPDSLVSLGAERENLMEVINGSDRTAAVDAAVALEALVCARGPLRVYLERVDALVARVEANDEAAIDARKVAALYRARGNARQLRGGGDAALADYQRAIELADSAGDHDLGAAVRVDRGVAHHTRRALDEARADYEAARALVTNDPRMDGRISGNLGAIEHDRRRLDAAAAHYETALRRVREAGDRRLEGIFRNNLALLEQERGRMGQARVHFDRALELLREVRDLRFEAITNSNLGSLLHETGDLVEAERCHRRAQEILRQVGERRSEGLALARLGAALASFGHLDDARRTLDDARTILDDIGDELSQAFVQLNLGYVDLAEHIRRWAAKDELGSQAALTSLRARIRLVEAAGPGGSASLADLSDDICTSVRILKAALAAIDESVEEGHQLGERSFAADALIVGPQCAWFRAPQGNFHDFRRRQAPRRMLWRLIEQQQACPGQGLPIDALIAAGWPGERIKQSAAENRAWVTLATLRKLGLKPFLDKDEDGYRLDPSLDVQHSPLTFKEVLEIDRPGERGDP